MRHGRSRDKEIRNEKVTCERDGGDKKEGEREREEKMRAGR